MRASIYVIRTCHVWRELLESTKASQFEERYMNSTFVVGERSIYLRTVHLVQSTKGRYKVPTKAISFVMTRFSHFVFQRNRYGC